MSIRQNLHGFHLKCGLLREILYRKPGDRILYDRLAMTGHCTYSSDCDSWRTVCCSCPLLRTRLRQACRTYALARYDLHQQADSYVQLCKNAIRTHGQHAMGRNQ